MKIIMFICLFIFVCQIIYYIIKYHRHIHGSGYFLELDCLEYETFPRLTFKQFLSFYNVNPDKWFIMDEERWYYHPTRLYKNNDGQPIAFKTIFDFIKYSKWVKKQFRDRKEKERDEKLQVIVNDVKNDIEEARVEMAKALDETEKTLTDTLTRLNKEEIPYFITDNINKYDKSKF